jgi:hypothetical protein
MKQIRKIPEALFVDLDPVHLDMADVEIFAAVTMIRRKA